MQFLLDTNVIIDLCKGNAFVIDRHKSVRATDRVVVNPVVVGEVLGGLLRMPEGARKQAYRTQLNRALSTFDVEPISDAVAEPYARLKHQQQLRGFRLADNDLWIAATAITFGMTLVTRDSDFSRIEGLPIENWSV